MTDGTGTGTTGGGATGESSGVRPGAGPKAARVRKRWGQPDGRDEWRRVPPELLFELFVVTGILSRPGVAERLLGTADDELHKAFASPARLRKRASDLATACFCFMPEDYELVGF